MADPRYEKIKDVAPPVEVRPIPGIEFYGAAADGRIWTYRRGRFMQPKVSKVGYLTVDLSRHGKTVTKTVHRLVAAAWLPNPGNLRCVNHLNSDRTDPRVENLEWCTHAKNSAHAVANGRMRRGANHPDAILTEERVLYIRESTEHPKFLSTRFGVSEITISDVRSRRSWKHM